MESLPTLAEIYPVNLAMQAEARELAVDALSYHLKRRDDLTDKLRFGLVALNGASIVALISALGGGESATSWLGFNAENSVVSAVCFVVGLVLAGSSLFSSQITAIEEAGDASVRAQKIGSLIAQFQGQASLDNKEELRKAGEDFYSLPLTGFKYSNWAITAQQFSGTAWLIGLIIPLASALRSIIT